MCKSKILLTAFKGSSAEQLIRYSEALTTLFLPNDKIKDAEKLISLISDGSFDYVFMFGQRPNIKNKLHIETTAKIHDNSLNTPFDYQSLNLLFKKNGITSKVSDNAGTSYCNSLYYNGLNYIQRNKIKTQIVFIHIPFLKNIDEKELFFKKIIEIILKYSENKNVYTG